MSDYKRYIRPNSLPTAWCAGCGDGQVLRAMLMAFDELGLEPDNTVICSGIGCWGKVDTYTNFNAIHGTHGRMPSYATGLKLANPELNVICAVGDGDGVTIGGNHFIHAARRNVDITVIMCNNYNYGMTGGQYSGTTPEEAITSTSRYGHIEEGFDVCKLAEAAGATYIARSTSENVRRTAKFIREAIQHKGFSLVEVVSLCPTHFARNNGMGTPAEILQWVRDREISAAEAAKLTKAELKNKIVIGKLYEDNENRDYLTRYKETMNRAHYALEHSVEPKKVPPRPLDKPWKMIVAGVGGQGAILCGNLLCTAASREAKTSTMLSAYGVEARGTYSKADVQISSEELNDFVEVQEPELVLILHTKAYERHVNMMSPGSVILYNSDEVEELPSNAKQFAVPMNKIAIDSGSLNAANMVALGALTAFTDAAAFETVEDAVSDFFASKPKALESNLKALRGGYDYVKQYIK